MNFDNYAHDKDLFNIKQKNNFDGKSPHLCSN